MYPTLYLSWNKWKISGQKERLCTVISLLMYTVAIHKNQSK